MTELKIINNSKLYTLILTKLLDPLRLCSATKRSEAVHAGVLDCSNNTAYFGRSSKAINGYYEEAERSINDDDLTKLIKKFIDTTLVTRADDDGGDWIEVKNTKKESKSSVTNKSSARHSAACAEAHAVCQIDLSKAVFSRTFIFAALREDDGNKIPRLAVPCERCEKWITACGASWVTSVSKEMIKISCPSDDTVNELEARGLLSLNNFK